jgi:hypothetical protein
VPQLGVLIVTGTCLGLLMLLASILGLVTGWIFSLYLLVYAGYGLVGGAAFVMLLVIRERVASRRIARAIAALVPVLLLVWLASWWWDLAHVGAYNIMGWLSLRV